MKDPYDMSEIVLVKDKRSRYNMKNFPRTLKKQLMAAKKTFV